MRDREQYFRRERGRRVRERFCDVMVHLNGLLPCAVVWWTLKVQKSAWLAVFLYESVCLVAVPWATLLLRGHARRHTASRLAPLLQSLSRPRQLKTCSLVTTGSVLVFGAGGFFLYLAFAQKEFEEHEISEEISRRSRRTGLAGDDTLSRLALVCLGVWFCTVNPVLEELFWRGYVYAELGRILNGTPGTAGAGTSSSSSGQAATTMTPFVVDNSGVDEELGDDGGGDDDDEQSEADSSTKHSRRSLLRSGEQSEASRWLVSLYFGSFHGVVVLIFVNEFAAVATWLFLAATSRAWIWLAERPPFGFPFVVAFHAGADVAVVLTISACDFGWAKRDAYVVALAVTFVLGCLGLSLLFVAWRDDTHLSALVPCQSSSSSVQQRRRRLRRSLAEGLLSSSSSAASSSLSSSASEDEEKSPLGSDDLPPPPPSSPASTPAARELIPTTTTGERRSSSPSSSTAGSGGKKKKNHNLLVVPRSSSPASSAELTF